MMDRKRIDLSASDWLWATWRPWEPRTRPEPREFRVDQCDKLTLAVARLHQHRWRWDKLQLPASLTAQEAEFWFRVMSNASHDVKLKELATWAARQTYPGKVTLVEVRAALKKKPMLMSANFIGVIAQLFDCPTIVDLMLNEISSGQCDHEDAVVGFHRYVLPFLSKDQIESLRNRLRADVQLAKWHRDQLVEFQLASVLGMHEEMLSLVQSWPDAQVPAVNHCAQLIVFGLGSAALVEQTARRLALRLRSADHVRAWLAHTECAALDFVHQSVVTSHNRETAEELLEALCLVREPEAARWLLEFRSDAAKAAHVKKWFVENPAAAIEGLLPVMKGSGKLAEAAGEVVWELSQGGHKETIEEALKRFAQSDPAAAAAARRAVFARDANLPTPFDEATTPSWLKPQAGGEKLKSAPTWVVPAALPAVVIDRHILNSGHVLMMLDALQRSTLNTIHPLLVTLKQHARPETLEGVAWKLFDAWQAEGAPTPHKWAIHSLGILGSDGVAIRLAELIRAWPSESLHARAAIGLECLRCIGTAGALMQLDSLSRKLRFAGLRNKAKIAMDQIAAARGLTREDLEDQVIPDCGLDAGGTRAFDLGERQVFLALDQMMKPMLKDSTGALRSSLPRPSRTDDPQKFEAAKAEWTLLKKQVSQVIKTQVDRLKKALSGSRRWSVPAFEALSTHPLMRHLVRGQIWALYGPQGSGPGGYVTSFRVTDEGDWADAGDEPLPRPEHADVKVGLLHPVHISDGQRQAWGELLGDYQIISAVPQLTRTFFQLTDEELAGSDIERFASSPCPSMILMSVFTNMGWEVQSIMDAGGAPTFVKPFVHADVTAVAVYGNSGGDLCISRLYFIKGSRKPETFADYVAAVRLNKIDPAVVSEAMRDISGVISVGAKEIARR